MHLTLLLCEAIGSPKNAAVLSPIQSMAIGYNTPERATFLQLFTSDKTDVDSQTEKYTIVNYS